MKYCILLLFIILVTSTQAHKQHVHQYLTKEGYYLLRNYIGGDINQMLAHLDNGPVGPAWTNGTLLAGAWREDEEDIVYGYNHLIIGDPGSLISISHFWNADEGDNGENRFDVSWSFFTGRIGPYPNAYNKLEAFANGGYDLNIELILYGFPTQSNGSGSCATQRAIVTFHYNSLIDLYRNKKIYVTKVNWLTGEQTIFDNPIRFFEEHWSLLNPGSYSEFFDIISFEILGRMCHLIQDMSVPAHTRCDEHGLTPDDYEKWISENYHWTYWNANNCGDILNPYVSNNPLHYLMYTTSQIANHFGSTGPYCSVGNDLLIGNPLPEEISYLNSINLGSLGSPVGQGPFYSVTLENIRNKTFPQVLKATAGLLYWFAKETNILPPPPLSATISGPSTAPCATGTWKANVSGGYPPYNCQWYHMYTSSGGLESSLQKETGIIQPDRLIDTWYPVGNNSSTLNYYLCGGNSYLRVDVRDSHNTLKTVQYYVAGSNGGGGGLEKEAADNNSNDYRLESETPKEYSLNQNYPNPFNPSTIISYTIKTEGRVGLKIYNTLGQEVKTLVDGVKSAGIHNAEFDASNLPSGIYIYRMQSGEYVSTRKMLLIK